MKTYLFIGGPADGERREVPDDALMREVATHPGSGNGGVYEKCPVSSSIYRKERIQGSLPDGSITSHEVFVVRHHGDVIGALIKNYPQPGTRDEVKVPTALVEELIRLNPMDVGYFRHLRKWDKTLMEHQAKHGL